MNARDQLTFSAHTQSRIPHSGTGPTHRGRPFPPSTSDWCNQNSFPLASLDVHPLADPLTNWQSVQVITAPPRDISVLPSQTLCFRDSFLFAHQIYHLSFSSTWCLERQKKWIWTLFRIREKIWALGSLSLISFAFLSSEQFQGSLNHLR